MNMIPTRLSDILKSLAQALQVSSVFPATVFVFLNCLVVIPQFVSLDLTEPSNLTLILTAILVLSYLLYAFNAPLIRLAEGYPFQHEWLGQTLSKCQKRKYIEYCDELKLCNEMIDEIVIRQAHLVSEHNLIEPEEKARHPEYRRLEQWKQVWETRRASARQSLYYHYPYPERSEADVIPTLLGNTIASFERYPYQHYGIDAVAVWPRIVPILQKESFTPFVENEKIVFDFLLNLAFLTFLLSVEAGCLVSLHDPITGFLLFVGLGIVAFVLYKAAVVGALNWGATIEVAFDLYRGHLRKALRLREPATLEQEREDWKQLSEFFIDGIPFDHFVYKGPKSSGAQKKSGAKKN